MINTEPPHRADECANQNFEEVAAARAIATIAHRGQPDKLGADYITHAERVAQSLTDPSQVATAWLHDGASLPTETRERLVNKYASALQHLGDG